MAFAPPTMPFGCFAACHTSWSSPHLRSGSYPCSFAPFILLLFSSATALPASTSFRLATAFAPFRYTAFQQAKAHPLPIIFACLAACCGFGFVMFFVRKTGTKKHAKPLRNTVLPTTLTGYFGQPLSRRTPPIPIPPLA